MQNETLPQAKKRAVQWKINALGLMFVVLLFCLNTYIGDQRANKKAVDYELLLLENEQLRKGKIRADSLINKQSQYINSHKVNG